MPPRLTVSLGALERGDWADYVACSISCVSRYDDRIPTVRDVQVRRRGVAAIAAMFCLSRFRLEINAEMRYVKDRNMIEFRLDQNHKTLALQEVISLPPHSSVKI